MALGALYSSVTVSTTTDGASLCLAFRIGRQTWFARVFRPIWTNVEKAGKLFPRCWCMCNELMEVVYMRCVYFGRDGGGFVAIIISVGGWRSEFNVEYVQYWGI